MNSPILPNETVVPAVGNLHPFPLLYCPATEVLLQARASLRLGGKGVNAAIRQLAKKQALFPRKLRTATVRRSTQENIDPTGSSRQWDRMEKGGENRTRKRAKGGFGPSGNGCFCSSQVKEIRERGGHGQLTK
jgi:hypothetical protein